MPEIQMMINNAYAYGVAQKKNPEEVFNAIKAK
jgi:hypothetical protein